MWLHKVGEEVRKNRKQGGGSFVIIAHVNCERCNAIIEEREVTLPNKNHKQVGSYYYQYSWCWKCGLYTPDLSSRTRA